MSSPDTSGTQRALLALSGVLVTLVPGELSRRVAGLVISGGQRRSNAAAEAETGAYRILALGESTTASYFVEGHANDWPAPLQRILNGRGQGRRFVVFNEGWAARRPRSSSRRSPGTSTTITPTWLSR